MSAQRLRDAAKVLRENAATATVGVWSVVDEGTDDWPHLAVYGGPNLQDEVTGGGLTESDAQYIAIMHPGVGLALADWLDLVAAWTDEGLGLVPPDINIGDAWADIDGQALVLADLILGAES